MQPLLLWEVLIRVHVRFSGLMHADEHVHLLLILFKLFARSIEECFLDLESQLLEEVYFLII